MTKNWRFVLLPMLAERAYWDGERAPQAEILADSLAELGISTSGGIAERGEDDHIRELCERMTAREASEDVSSTARAGLPHHEC